MGGSVCSNMWIRREYVGSTQDVLEVHISTASVAPVNFAVAVEIDVQPDISQSLTNESKAPLLIITPRREENLHSSVIDTPVGEKAHIFRYYCPLCMQFFRDILKSECCGNYTCLSCLKGYLATKGLHKQSVVDLLTAPQLNSIACPHCFTTGLCASLVTLQENARDYSRKIEPYRISPVSPVRIGDTFEDLKRKMIPFEVSTKTPIEEETDIKEELTVLETSTRNELDPSMSPPPPEVTLTRQFSPCGDEVVTAAVSRVDDEESCLESTDCFCENRAVTNLSSLLDQAADLTDTTTDFIHSQSFS